MSRRCVVQSTHGIVRNLTFGRDGLAPIGVGTTRRIERCRPVRHLRQPVPRDLQLIDLPVDLSHVAFEQRQDVATGLLASIAHIENGADLGEAQPARLSVADEADTSNGLLAVLAIAVGRPGRFRHHADLFVVANRLRRDTRTIGDLSDSHVTDSTCLADGRRLPLRKRPTTVCRMSRRDAHSWRLTEWLPSATTDGRWREPQAALHQLRRTLANAAIDLRYGSLLAIDRRRETGLFCVSNSDYRVLAQIFLARIAPDDVLVDVGCGAGRVINYWLHLHPGQRIVGIEADPEIARAVARRLQRHTNAEIRTGDGPALLPSDGTLFYLFNPFGRDTMQRLSERVAEIAASSSRPVRILYYNCKHVDVFDADARWEVEVVRLPAPHHAPLQPLAVITPTCDRAERRG